MRGFTLPTVLAALAAGWCGHAAVSGRSPSLGVRNAHAMTYDSVGARVVLFGGADAERVQGDTWMYRGARGTWEPVSDRGPGPRTFPAMTFDAARGEVVLYGGNRVLFGASADHDTFLDDTWLLTGKTWRRVETAGPGPRAEAAMAYDAKRRRAVLFGGYHRAGADTVRLGDTWEWDGQRWHRVASDGPAARNGASLAYDESLERIVLLGGPPRLVAPDVWSWDGLSWRLMSGPPPPGRFNAALIYHPGLKGLLRFGGWTGERRADDTWARLADRWRDLRLAGPSPRNHTAMAHDTARGRTVLFGGHDGEVVFGDTWEFAADAWTRVGDQPARRRADNGH